MVRMLKHSKRVYNYTKGIRFFLCLFLYILVSNDVQSQEYIGAIILDNSSHSKFIYKLNLKNSNGVITGYSITNPGKKIESKSTLSGKLSGKNLRFKEINVLNKNKNLKINEMCFIDFKGKVLDFKGNSIIKGKFIGKYKNNKQCAKGDIYLTSTETLLKILDTLSNVKNNPIADSIKKAIKQKPSILKSNQYVKINMDSKDLKLQIWDNDRIDRDKIKVKVNNRVLYDELRLTDKQVVIDLSRETKPILLEIISIDDGFFPPNTSNFKLVNHNDSNIYIGKFFEKESVFIEVK